MKTLLLSVVAASGISTALSAQAAWSRGPTATFLTGQVAYGPAQRVWYAGLGAGGAFVVTSWNGQSWIAAPGAAPPAREGHAMAFDPQRNRLVLFGGRNLARTAVLGDLWEFDGATWLQRTPAGAQPTPRFLHVAAWDGSRSAIAVGFGNAQPSPWGTGLGDLWEWNGAAWLQRIPNGPRRIGPALAHDPLRNELVLAAGHGAAGFPMPMPTSFSDTYVLGPAAASWTLRATTGPRVSAAGAAFDPTRAQVVFTGGTEMGNGGYDPFTLSSFLSTSATWGWNGTNWIPDAPLPSVRSTTSLVFDASANVLVLVGGEFGRDVADVTALGFATVWAGVAGVPRDLTAMSADPVRGRVVGLDANFSDSRTWEWDGAGWLELAVGGATPYARYASLSWDPVLQRTLLMAGGSVGSIHSNDLFAWNGSTWALLQPATRPPARRSAALTADLRRGVVVLYGGWVPHVLGGEVTVGDTWEWNGANWSQAAPAVSPGPRAYACLAFDRRRGVAVLHGGMVTTPLLTDTWQYDGVQWLQRASTPTTVAQPRMAWDDARERIVLTGIAPPQQPATYEFDGTNWATLASSSPPWQQTFVGMGSTYDTVAERIVTYDAHATWFYATPFPASATAYGTGCASSAGPLQLTASARPWLGDSAAGMLAPVPPGALPFLACGWSNSMWGTIPLPASLASLGAPGCEIVADPLAVFLLPAGSTAPWSLPLPNLVAFVGLDLFAQGGVFDPPANPLGLATSNGLALRLGIR